MERAEEPTVDAAAALDAADRASRSPISVAILAAVACLPIVIAAGFLLDRPASGTAAVPADISVLALRGGIDSGADRRAAMPARAGY